MLAEKGRLPSSPAEAIGGFDGGRDANMYARRNDDTLRVAHGYGGEQGVEIFDGF